MRQRIRAIRPAALIVTDMGSRGEEILPGRPRVPTLLIDHHQPRGLPPNATIVSAHACEPVASSSLLVFELINAIVDLDDQDWLALIGTVGDLGAWLPFGVEWNRRLKSHGQTAILETVALLNAARRSSRHEVATALRVLRQANSPKDIASGNIEGCEILHRCRQEVQAELTQALRVAPKFAGQCALLSFSSAAQIHPLIATRWARTLKKYIVMAANSGYLPRRVNFSVRTATDTNLVEWLAALVAHSGAGEFGHGHPQASGGSLPPENFERLLQAIGFRAHSRKPAESGRLFAS